MDIYFLLLIALGVLAIVDLVVGVSNDAVNFLNSGIGSKALSFKTLLIIASLGVFIGAATSSGMMEVARKGIFVPGEFYFNEIMFIFMAVMITDIILLDIFNNLGLPTSTTVSLVFGLLGSAVITALLKIYSSSTETFADLGKYINSENALEIILGIFLSIAVAFTVGSFVMYIARIIYSFHYKMNKNYLHAVFGGIALTAIMHFIVLDGLKGTPFYKNIRSFVSENELLLMGVSFVVWTLIGFILTKFTKINLLKIIIALGTFSLALAFAGNDLVNFIGSPIAGLNSYQAWSASGIPADEFSMGILAQKVPTQTGLLLLAGLVMVLTLWFSKKARHVTNTEVGLANENEGEEKFLPNELSRVAVRSAQFLNNLYLAIMPKSLIEKIDKRFEKKPIQLPLDKTVEIPAFDQVRASVNLLVSSILISIATTHKLPLSTTYVTFMVAMGSSLADRAWGLESAVYRVAGVLNVIGGWFITALAAFITAGMVVFLMQLGGFAAAGVLFILALGLMVRNYYSFYSSYKEKKARQEKQIVGNRNISNVVDETSEHISEIVKRVNKLYSNVCDDLAAHDLNKLKRNKKHVDVLDKEVNDLKNGVFYYIKSLNNDSVEASHFYILILKYIQDISQSINYISTATFEHVNNNHKKLKKNQMDDLKNIDIELNKFLKEVEIIFQNKNYAVLNQLIDEKYQLFRHIEKLIDAQVNRIRTEESSPKNSTLYFSILLESKDLLNAIIKMLELYGQFRVKNINS